MWLPLILLLCISHFTASLNQKRFDKLRLQSEFHPKVVFATQFHSKNGSDLQSQRDSVLHDDPLLDDEFRAHFVESNYDFMIPEGQQEKPSIAAILSFVSDSSVDAPSFEINDQFDWFTIGSQKSQTNEGVLETEVSIDTKEGVLIDSKKVDGEAYSLQVTGKSGNTSVSVPVRVDILPSFGVIKVMSEDIKKSSKTEEESEIAVDSREEIEGTEEKTTPNINPTTSRSTIEVTTEHTTTTLSTTTPTTTIEMTTVPTTVSTTPSTTTTQSTTVTLPSTTETTTESTTTSTTQEPTSTSAASTTTEETTTVVSTTPSTTTTESTTTTTTQPSTATPVSIRLNIDGLSEDGSIRVKSGLSKGELISDFFITVERNGRPDGSLFNVTVDRSDLFDIQPKSVEQGGKAFLFVRNPHLIRETKGLIINITAVSSLSSHSTSLPVSLISHSSSEIIHFSIHESSSNRVKVGDLPTRSIERIFALEGLPFNLVNGSLYLSCESELCLDREEVDHYEFFIKFTDNVTPVPVVVRVEDVNDNPPSISLTESIIRVSANRLLNPVAVMISDADSSSSQSNALILTGDSSHFFTLKHINEGVYDLQLTSSPSNGNYSLTVTVIDTSRPDFSSHSIDVSIVVQRGKARFRKELYERTIAADKIAPGDSLLRLELEGIPVDEVDIVCLGGNPGWITVENYGGKMSASTLPRKGIETGEFTLLMGAISRETSEVVADTRVKITVEGGVKREVKTAPPFHKNIYTFKTIREHSDSDIHSLFSVDIDVRDSSVSPVLIPSSIFTLDSNGLSTPFPLSSLSLNGSTLSIERSSYVNLRLIRMEVEAEGEIASVLIFFSSSSIVIDRLRRERSRPLFSLPDGTEDDLIEISLLEESPLGTVVAVLPAVDVSKGENVETRLEGDMATLFHLQQTTGSIVLATRVDVESLSSPFFNLSLVAGEEPFESRLILHFTVENVDDNPPVVHSDSLVVNTSLWENAALSSRVCTIKASDIDSSSLRFSLVGEKTHKFTVNPSEDGGIVTLEKEIHREEDGHQLSLTVLVIDSAGHTAEATVNIKIMDVNDNSPVFVSLHSTQLKAVENWGEGRLLSVVTAIDSDQGENGRVQYRLTQSSPFVSINKTSGELRLARDLIGMAGEEIPLTVMAHDSGSPQRSTLLNLTLSVLESMGKESLLPKITNLPEDFVIEVNDNSPIRSRVFTVGAVSPSGGNEGLTYDLLPSTPSEAGWMDVNEENGQIFLLRSLDAHEMRHISGVLTVRSSPSSFTRSIIRLHVNASTHSLSPPVKENTHLVYPLGGGEEWPKIVGYLPVDGSVERIFDDNCSNSSSISIGESGEISVFDQSNEMDDMEVCVSVRRGSSTEGTPLRFSILKEEENKKGIRFIPLHAHSIVLGKEGINDNSVFSQENEVEYKLKSVNFTRVEKTFDDSDEKKEDFSSLFVVDPSTSKVIVDPSVRMKKNGFYDVTIEAMRDNETVGEFKREIHSMSSSSQVRLVFDMNTHELGRNLERFETKLNTILTGRGRVYLTDPSIDLHSNKSSVCAHVLLDSSLMPQSTAFSLLSLPPSDSPLTNLYHAYKVSNLGMCDSSFSVSSLISSSFSSSFIITSSIVSLLSFILISSLLYVCCVIRERDRFTSIQSSINKESQSPQLATPPHFYALTAPKAIVPYGLY